MERQELKEKIHCEIHEAKADNLPPLVLTESIMLLIDNYIEQKEKQLLPSEAEAWKMEVKSHVTDARMSLELLQRRGFTLNEIFNYLEAFLEKNYPDCKRSPLHVQNHFFNSMRYQKPIKDGKPTSKTDEAADWFNQ
jgi:hypothetical protein